MHLLWGYRPCTTTNMMARRRFVYACRKNTAALPPALAPRGPGSGLKTRHILCPIATACQILSYRLVSLSFGPPSRHIVSLPLFISNVHPYPMPIVNDESKDNANNKANYPSTYLCHSGASSTIGSTDMISILGWSIISCQQRAHAGNFAIGSSPCLNCINTVPWASHCFHSAGPNVKAPPLLLHPSQ